MTTTQNKNLIFRDLGVMNYTEAFTYQEKLMREIIDLKLSNRTCDDDAAVPTPNYLLFVEHPHVYTMGKSGHDENVLFDSRKLQEIDAIFVKTNRGGDITYHGFGQLVGYPVLDLDNFKSDVFLYLRNLEEVIIRVLAEYDLKGERSEGETGVWLDAGKPFARKICAMGVKTSKWVTMHGFALNINTDLRYFDYIIPCGIRGKSVTSIERELAHRFSTAEIESLKKKIITHFCDIFAAKII